MNPMLIFCFAFISRGVFLGVAEILYCLGKYLMLVQVGILCLQTSGITAGEYRHTSTLREQLGQHSASLCCHKIMTALLKAFSSCLVASVSRGEARQLQFSVRTSVLKRQPGLRQCVKKDQRVAPVCQCSSLDLMIQKITSAVLFLLRY